MSFIVELPPPPTRCFKATGGNLFWPSGAVRATHTYLCHAHAITLEACPMYLLLIPVRKHPRGKGVRAPVTPPPPREADSTREDPPAAYELQIEAVSCSLWPCQTAPRLSGVKMCLWYCWGGGGAAGVEFRQLQSSQGIVSAWAPAAPELDADETLSPEPSCIGLGFQQALHSPLSLHFPQQ